MRHKRLKHDGAGYYHLISRIVDKDFKFNNEEKSIFVDILRKSAIFSGIEVLTYAVMSNHFHLLVHTPAVVPLSEEVILSRVKALYGKIYVHDLKCRWDELRRSGNAALVELEQECIKRRMGDISQFMKTLKQRVSMSYNTRHGRQGTIWESRFKSLLLEGSESVLCSVAAYIDLNPVRAGLVISPEEYIWSGYGAASAGMKRERAGLRKVFISHPSFKSWHETSRLYGKILSSSLSTGEESAAREQTQEVLRRNGALPLLRLLRYKIRYFSSGLAVGGKDFVEKIFSTHRDYFGSKRQSGARRIRAFGDFEIYSARDLRKDAISIPSL